MTNDIAVATTTIYGLPVPIFTALLSAMVSAIVALVVATLTLRAHRRQHIENMISKLVDVAITYPYLEDDRFCDSWNEADKNDEKAMRYDNYCCLVFNLLETLWKQCGGDTKRIESIFFAREMIVRHKRWWKSERNNLGGYDINFHRYIDTAIKGE